MTKKRFNLVGSYLYHGDECVSHFDDPHHRNEIVDLLNNLAEENERLKESNQLLIEYSEYYRKLCIYFDNQINEVISENALLEKENKQLKEIFKTMIKQLEIKIDSEETIYQGTFVFSGESFMVLKKLCK